MIKLRQWREANNLSMEEVAERLGVSGRMTIYRYERGRVPEPDTLQKIIEITEGAVTADDWFEVPAHAQQKGAA